MLHFEKHQLILKHKDLQIEYTIRYFAYILILSFVPVLITDSYTIKRKKGYLIVKQNRKKLTKNQN